MNWLKQNSLVLSIILAVVMGWLTPEWGAKNGHLQSQILIKVGVVLIFIAQGLSLSTRAMIEGIKFWPLHLFTQFWIFLGIPLIALGGLALSGDLLSEGLKMGLFFLAILPTTVSSAVALVGQAEGNVAGSVFNTVFANLAAIFILPAWLLWYQTNLTGTQIDIWPILIQLIFLLLLPFLIGHLARPLVAKYDKKIKAFTKPMNQWIIAFMVYAAFATSFRDQVWAEVGTQTALSGAMVGICLLLSASVTIAVVARWAFKAYVNRVTAFFTGSQKSLAVGIPYAAAFFTTVPEGVHSSFTQSVIILPLLFYHPLQLLLGSLVIRFRNTAFGAPTTSTQPQP